MRREKIAWVSKENRNAANSRQERAAKEIDFFCDSRSIEIEVSVEFFFSPFHKKLFPQNQKHLPFSLPRKRAERAPTNVMPLVQAILWERGPPASLKLLDQRLLPQTTSYVDVNDADGGWRAIREMVVRGAPALAVAAALSLAREACDDLKAVGMSAQEAAEYFVDRATYLETR